MIYRYKYAVLVFTVLAAVPHSAHAQSGIDRQIEVTSRYVPDVEQAGKLDFIPTMKDTVALKPDLDYSITPTAWIGTFEATPMNPVKIVAEEYRPEQPFYLRLAGGVPWQTLGDFYATASTANNVLFGAYVNHYGRWAKLMSDAGWEERAMATRNIGGVRFSKTFARRTLLTEVKDEYRHYRTMSAPFQPEPTGENSVLRYNDLSVSASFGDAFTDLSSLNYRFGMSASNFAGSGNAAQNNVTAFADLGWRMGNGDFMLGSYFSSTNGVNALADYSDRRLRLSPMYAFGVGELSVALGLDFVYNDHIGESDFRLFPQIVLHYNAFNAFVPYLDVYGRMADGGFEALSRVNPYLAVSPVNGVGNLFLQNPSNYGAKLGGYGSITQAISYNLYVNAELWQDYSYFVNIVNPIAYFVPQTNRSANIFSVGASISALLAKGLTLDCGFKGITVSQSDARLSNAASTLPVATLGETKSGLGIPAYEVETKLKWDFREKFYLSAGIVAAGKREVSTVTAQPSTDGTTFEMQIANSELPATVNLRLEAEYQLNKKFNIFIWGDNLLDQRIYTFNHYPDLGTNVMLGLKMVF